MGPEGPAAQQPAPRQDQAPPEAVERERLLGVLGAARVEAAGRDPSGGGRLIGREETQGHPDGATGPCVRAAHDVVPLRPARRSAVATSARKAAAARPAAPGSRRTRYLPGARPGTSLRTTSRARRRRRLRTTAPPQRRPTAYPTWGNAPGAPSSAGTNATLTGPHAPFARARRSSVKAARLVILPTVGTGTGAIRR